MWADLARFDYHFVEHRESEDTIGSMSDGEFHMPSRLTTASHSMLKPRGSITRLVAYLVSLFVSTHVQGVQSAEVSGYAQKHKALLRFPRLSQVNYVESYEGNYGESMRMKSMSGHVLMWFFFHLGLIPISPQKYRRKKDAS